MRCLDRYPIDFVAECQIEALAGDPPEDRVDKTRRRRLFCLADEFDALIDGRERRYAVKKQQLVDTDAQSDPDCTVEFLFADKFLDQTIEIYLTPERAQNDLVTQAAILFAK